MAPSAMHWFTVDKHTVKNGNDISWNWRVQRSECCFFFKSSPLSNYCSRVSQEIQKFKHLVLSQPIAFSVYSLQAPSSKVCIFLISTIFIYKISSSKTYYLLPSLNRVDKMRLQKMINTSKRPEYSRLYVAALTFY